MIGHSNEHMADSTSEPQWCGDRFNGFVSVLGDDILLRGDILDKACLASRGPGRVELRLCSRQPRPGGYRKGAGTSFGILGNAQEVFPVAFECNRDSVKDDCASAY
jgi:hypothetical protein